MWLRLGRVSNQHGVLVHKKHKRKILQTWKLLWAVWSQNVRYLSQDFVYKNFHDLRGRNIKVRIRIT